MDSEIKVYISDKVIEYILNNKDSEFNSLLKVKKELESILPKLGNGKTVCKDMFKVKHAKEKNLFRTHLLSHKYRVSLKYENNEIHLCTVSNEVDGDFYKRAIKLSTDSLAFEVFDDDLIKKYSDVDEKDELVDMKDKTKYLISFLKILKDDFKQSALSNLFNKNQRESIRSKLGGSK